MSFIRKLVLCLIGLIITLVALTQDNIEFKRYNLEQGLSHTHILSIDQDTMGYLWLGTFNGVNKFDGRSFIRYGNIPGDSTSPPANIFHDIHVDHTGTVWFGTESGFCSYNRITDNFKNYSIEPPKNIFDNYHDIRSIARDDNDNLWIGTYRNGLLKYNIKSGYSIWFQHDSTDQSSISSNNINKLYFDSEGDLWICHEEGKLSYYRISESKFITFPFCENYLTAEEIDNKSLDCLNGNVFTSVVEDKNGEFWASTWHTGVVRYDKNGNRFEYFIPRNKYSNNSCMYTIRDLASYNNKLYVAIYGGGVAVLNKSTNKFEALLQNNESKTSLSQNFAWEVFIDKESNLWVGTFEGGLNMTPLTNQKSYVFNGFKDKQVEIENVTSIIEDINKNVWVGTQETGIFKIDYKEQTIDNIFIDTLPVAVNNISSITQDKDNRIWFGTDLGVLQYNPANKKLTHYTKLRNPEIASDVITSVISDKDGNIWLGTYAWGIIVIPYSEIGKNVKDVNIKTYTNQRQKPNSLSSNFIEVIYKDFKNNIWVGSKGGIDKYDSETDGFVHISDDVTYIFQDDGYGSLWYDTYRGPLTEYKREDDELFPRFANEAVRSMEVCKGKIWFTAQTDVYTYDLKTNEINNLTERGLFPSMLFRPNSSLKLENNTLLFGSSEGIIQFHPDSISIDANNKQVYIKNIVVNNKPVKINEKIGGKIILDKAPDVEDNIVIPPSVKTFTIEFGSIVFNFPDLESYAYMLEGFDTTWTHTSGVNRIATFTNLDGGKYTFKVANTNGKLNRFDQIKTLDIRVVPPYYKTLWFRIVFILFIIGVVSASWLIRLSNIKKANKYLENQVKLRTLELQKSNEQLKLQTQQLNETNTLLEERQQRIQEQTEELRAQRDVLHEANSVKDRLFGVIAHDLKNPFNNLMGFLGLLKKKFDEYPPEKTKNMINMISDSSEKIYNLLIGLLDWSRAQQGTISFKPVECNISELIIESVKLLETQAIMKSIDVKLILDESIRLKLDINLINIVLRNLISNAIKFTNACGTITISCEKENSYAVAHVKDNGVGMPANIAENIFKNDSYHSTFGTDGERGTGLGLQTVKDFVKLHGGKIWVESQEGKGSDFTFKLPLTGN